MANPNEIESREYLEKHKILDLFQNLTAQLFYSQPVNPKQFLIERIESLIAARAQGQFDGVDLKNGLFNDDNIRGMFMMLDINKQGFISQEKYKHGLITLGCRDFDTCPEGFDTGTITMDTFVEEAKRSLSKAYATFIELPSLSPEEIEGQETTELPPDYFRVSQLSLMGEENEENEEELKEKDSKIKIEDESTGDEGEIAVDLDTPFDEGEDKTT